MQHLRDLLKYIMSYINIFFCIYFVKNYYYNEKTYLPDIDSDS
jgi:hypothetical protein